MLKVIAKGMKDDFESTLNRAILAGYTIKFVQFPQNNSDYYYAVVQKCEPIACMA